MTSKANGSRNPFDQIQGDEEQLVPCAHKKEGALQSNLIDEMKRP